METVNLTVGKLKTAIRNLDGFTAVVDKNGVELAPDRRFNLYRSETLLKNADDPVSNNDVLIAVGKLKVANRIERFEFTVIVKEKTS